MEDELEDKVLYQTYISHMKLLSKYGVGLPLNSAFFSYIWRVLRMYIVRPEIMFISVILFVVCLYLQTLEMWSRGLFAKVLINVNKSRRIVGVGGKSYVGQSWELKEENLAVYAVQGRRLRMEDRFVVNENIKNTGVSLYAIFDGHGGDVRQYIFLLRK